MKRFNTDDWIAIEKETYREYVFDGGYVYRIDNAVKMFISSTGTHFVLDAKGIVHTVQKGVFKVLRFDGELEFVEPSIK